MAETEVFQTRLDPDIAEQVHEYREERRISKAEATRRLVTAGLTQLEDDENEDQEATAAREREDRIQILARLAEKTAMAGVAFTILSILIPGLSGVAVTTFNLSIAEFGMWVIFGFFGLTFGVAVLLVFISILPLAAIAILYGIEAGFFGRTVANYLPTPEREAAA